MAASTTVEKALDVLFHLNAAGACGVTAIGQALGLPKSTAHRLLAALGRRGLVERDERGRYRPGLGLVGLGLGALEREPIVAAARPVLEEEAAASGETLFLAASRSGRVVVLDKVEGTGFLRAAPRVGAEVPLHATAVGKLHLAFAPGGVRLSDGRLERFTPRTRAGREALARETARVRAAGWAENREEWLPGLAVVAAPIWARGELAGALALAAPSVRVGAGRRRELVVRIRAAARRIEACLAGRPGAAEGGAA